MSDDFEKILKALAPRPGRPSVDPVARVRDRYCAVWLKASTSESFGGIERALSARKFDHRDIGSGGYNQPQLVARAARGAGKLPDVIVKNACERIAGFRQIYEHCIWTVLSRGKGWGKMHPGASTAFDPNWIHQVGLSSPSLASVWREDWTLAHAPVALIRRAGRLSDLSALALLIECTKCPAGGSYRSALIESYAVDVFARLRGGIGQSYSSELTAQQEAFRSAAESLRDVIVKGVRWHLPGLELPPPPMIRARPASLYRMDLTRLCGTRANKK